MFKKLADLEVKNYLHSNNNEIIEVLQKAGFIIIKEYDSVNMIKYIIAKENNNDT